jgi:hypothetical protein
MKDHFRIGMSREPVALLEQLFRQLNIVKDLTIEGDPKRALGVRHRLPAAREVNNAQARVSESHLRIDMNANLIGAAVADHVDHQPRQIRVNRRAF